MRESTSPTCASSTLKSSFAGRLRDAPGGPFVGGLWVLDVVSRDRAVELVEHDPCFTQGARRYKLQVWGNAIVEKAVLL